MTNNKNKLGPDKDEVGLDNTYIHLPSKKHCYICAIHVDDGACLIIELYTMIENSANGDLEPVDLSGDMITAEWSDLEKTI